MRFAELNPQWWIEYRDRELTPDHGGIPTGNYDLRFTCPACGAPHVITIKIGPSICENPRRWRADPMPGGADWPERVTITPSIDNTKSGHGRKHPSCSFHGNIVLGVVNKN